MSTQTNPEFRSLASAGLPIRGLLGSLLVHVCFVIIAVETPWDYWIPRAHLEPAPMAEHEVLYLPELHPAQAASPDNSGLEAALASAASALPRAVYKGARRTVSNPPDPDNTVQTIRQPEIIHPPRLPWPMAFPAMMTIATPSQPAIAPKPIAIPPRQVETSTVSLTEVIPPVEVPKLPAPVAAPPAMAPPLTSHSAAPSPQGDALHTVIIVNAIDVSARAPELPPGELYGAFVVSPDSASLNGTLSAGNSRGSASGTAVPAASSNGAGSNGGHGPGSGSGGGAPGVSNGNPSGSGRRTGAANGRADAGNGSAGTGNNSGSSPFPGISIQGGTRASSRTQPPDHRPPAARQQPGYEITIIANGASGGGFKDYGIFHDEAAYTVYIDMADTGAAGPSWTMQYALDSSAGTRSRALLVPPYALSKPLPHFDPRAALRCRSSTLVVFGVIGESGDFQQLRILQTPDPVLSEPLLQALSQWSFHPAEMAGSSVAVKVLLGIPLQWAARKEAPAEAPLAHGGDSP